MTWTVNRRIAVGFTLVLSLVVLLSILAVGALRQASNAYEEALHEQRDILVPALMAEGESRAAAVDQLRHLLDPTREETVAIETRSRTTRDLLRQLQGAAPTPEERAVWEQALSLQQRWDEEVGTAMAAADAGRTDEAHRLWEARALPVRLQLREVIDQGVQSAQQRSQLAAEAADNAARRMQRLLIGGATLALLIGILSAILLSRAVTRPLRETTGVLASSAAEILAATTEQASGATQTSSAVMETSTTVDEVAQTAAQAAERAQTMADTAQRAAEIGRRGRQAVDESVVAMGGVQEQVESIADSILTLAEQAQAIGEIIATVDDIAEQTNLLALNAAVEAARAGEEGRGFAVVAQEVRTLADQSKQATVRVRQMLGEIQRATSTAVMTTERGTQQVHAGTARVTEAGETIRSLAEALADAAQGAAQILASAGQQSAGMSQIRQAMRDIQDATQQNLSATRQAEQAAQDLNRLGLRLLVLVGNQDRVGAGEQARA